MVEYEGIDDEMFGLDESSDSDSEMDEVDPSSPSAMPDHQPVHSAATTSATATSTAPTTTTYTPPLQPISVAQWFLGQAQAGMPPQTVNPFAVSLAPAGGGPGNNETEAGLDGPEAHPAGPDPNLLISRNSSALAFLKQWALTIVDARTRRRIAVGAGGVPSIHGVRRLVLAPTGRIKYADLMGDDCDMQGINWRDLGVMRRNARDRRLTTYVNYVHVPGADKWHPHLPDTLIPATENFFRFRSMDIKRNAHLSHFQLRNVLACTSGSRAFYSGRSGVVHEFDRVTGKTTVAVRFEGEVPGRDMIATLATGHGVLIAGGIDGNYYLRRVDEGSGTGSNAANGAAARQCYRGCLTTDPAGITNHIQIHESRASGGAPRAAFANNDASIRTLDLHTQQILYEDKMPFPINCTALSPDGRLRVSVGDHPNVLITAAEPTSSSPPSPTTPPGTAHNNTAEVLASLAGHRDHGFACDWAPDGWTVATAFQDRAVKIWDARRWTDTWGQATPVHTLRADMAGVRALRFSPAGSGRRVLVAAQEADFVDVIDAATFRTKQSIDLFGEIAGVGFADQGRDLVVLCADPVRGGIVQLERCRGGAFARLTRPPPSPAAVEWGVSSYVQVDDDTGGGEVGGDGGGQAPRKKTVMVQVLNIPSPVQRWSLDAWLRWRRQPGQPDSAVGPDWRESVFTERGRVRTSAARRKRRLARAEELDPF